LNIISASISKPYWDYFAAIKSHFPFFVYPLPRDDNKWLFYIGFWGGNELNFTTLEHYKLKGADAPVLLSMCHYPDLVGERNFNPSGQSDLFVCTTFA
jgi:hypothetical protein